MPIDATRKIEAHRRLESEIRSRCKYKGFLKVIRLDVSIFPEEATVVYATREGDLAGRPQRVSVPGLLGSVYSPTAVEKIAQNWPCEVFQNLTPSGRDATGLRLHGASHDGALIPPSAVAGRGEVVFLAFEYRGETFKFPLPEKYDRSMLLAYIDEWCDKTGVP